MTTNKTDFSSYTTGDPPSDWVISWITTNQTWAVREKTGALGGKTLEHIASVDGRRFIYWSNPGSVTGDVEVLIKWRTTDTTLNNIPARAHIHTRGSSTQSTQYAYTLDLTIPSTLRLGRTSAGTYSTLSSATLSFSVTANTWYWYRLRRSGNSLYGKCWEDGTTEPTSWNITTSDTTITYGYVGCGAFDFNGTRDFDFFSYGTAGDSAPNPTIDMASTVECTSNILGNFSPYYGLAATNNIQSTNTGNILVIWSLPTIVEIISNILGSCELMRATIDINGYSFLVSEVPNTNISINLNLQSTIQNQSNTESFFLVEKNLSVIITNQSEIIGSLDLTIPLIGSSDCQSSTVGQLNPILYLTSTVNPATDIIVDLTRIFSLAGTTLANSSDLGIFSNLLDISILSLCQSSTDIILTKYVVVESITNPNSNIIASVGVFPPVDLASTVNLANIILGSIGIELPLIGIINIVADTSGYMQLAEVIPLQGIINLQSSTDVTLRNTIPIQSIIQIVGNTSGIVEVVPPVDLAGIILGQSSTVVSLEDVIPISSIISLVSETYSNLQIVEPTYIQGEINCQANTMGYLGDIILIASTVTIAGSTSGNIVTIESIPLQSISNPNSSTLGAIRTFIGISGNSSPVSTTEANLGHIISIQSILEVNSISTGNVTRYYNITSIITGSVGIVSTLSSGATQDLQVIANINSSCFGNILLDWALKSNIEIISQAIARFEEESWILKGDILGQSDVLGILAFVILTQLTGSFDQYVNLNGSAINDNNLDGSMENIVQIGGEF